VPKSAATRPGLSRVEKWEPKTVDDLSWPQTTSTCTYAEYAGYFERVNRVWSRWITDTSVTGSTTVSDTFTFPIGSGITQAASDVWNTVAWQSNAHTEGWRLTRAESVIARVESLADRVLRQHRERIARRERLRDRQRAQRFRSAADRRAEDLLRSMLSEEQRRELDEHNHFHVRVPDPRQLGCQRVYRIERGFQGNVKLIENGRATRRYCIHADARLPHADQMLAQKLMLESDEADFLRIANMTLQ